MHRKCLLSVLVYFHSSYTSLKMYYSNPMFRPRSTSQLPHLDNLEVMFRYAPLRSHPLPSLPPSRHNQNQRTPLSAPLKPSANHSKSQRKPSRCAQLTFPTTSFSTARSLNPLLQPSSCHFIKLSNESERLGWLVKTSRCRAFSLWSFLSPLSLSSFSICIPDFIVQVQPCATLRDRTYLT